MTCWYPGVAEEILKGLYAQIRPSLMLFLEGAGYLPDWDVILMQIAYCLEPESLGPLLLIKSAPYTHPDFFLERMRAAAGRGWLYVEGDKFSLTDPGREVVEGVYELCDRLYARVRTLPDQEIAQLLDMSDRLIASIKDLDEPDEKPAFELSLIYFKDEDRSPIVQLRQRMFAVLAFRDDAHVAAWRPFEKDGQIWECFTLIWRERASSVAELAEKLSHRNFTRRDYAAIIQKLNVRDWITVQEGSWIARPGAAQMRQDVEDSTERIFCNAFTGLSFAEKREFRERMGRLAFEIAQYSNRKDEHRITIANPSSICKAPNA